MGIRIIKAGVLDTIQDAGRNGFRHWGINPSGAMDEYAMQLANILVGNNPADAVIEMHFPASSFFFEEEALIAISGADFCPMLNAEPIPINQPVLVSRFSILQMEGLKKGARAYLAVHGGLLTTEWLGSKSTHLKIGAGGNNGKALHKEDMIGIKSSKDLFVSKLEKKEYKILPWKANNIWEAEVKNEIMVLPGNEWDLLNEQSKKDFEQYSFSITTQSDRMGYRLKADPLVLNKQEEIISSGVCFGTIQLLPDGQLIVLMADHQATGGYPRVATVITAHRSRLAQCKAGEAIHFRITDQLIAEKLFIKQKLHLQQLENSCKLRMSGFLNC